MNSFQEALPQQPFTDVVPNILIGSYESELPDDQRFFMRMIRPHLITAYKLWHETMKAGRSDSDLAELTEAHGLMSVGLVAHMTDIYNYTFQRAQILHALGAITLEIDPNQVDYNPKGFEMLYKVISKLSPNSFYVNVYGKKAIEAAPGDIEDTVLDFTSLLSYQHWEKFFLKTGIPFAMKFERPLTLFPRVIEMGELVLERVFDLYVLPTFVRQSPYREKFYDHFADLYERKADMQIKKAVFRKLFELMPGNDNEVLDVGCGTGLAHANRPKDRTVRMLGIEANSSMAEIARHKGQEVWVGKIENFVPEDGKRYDNAMMSFVDYWIPQGDKRQVFVNLRKLIKPGGKIVFNIHKPCGNWQQEYQDLLVDECGYSSVNFYSEQIERTGGGVYTAYYLVAEV